MTDFEEQRNCIKFCFNLKKKTFAETHQMLQEAFGDNAMNQSKTFYGADTSRMDQPLSTMCILDNCRQAQHRKT
jgi:hypothetical protein